MRFLIPFAVVLSFVASASGDVDVRADVVEMLVLDDLSAASDESEIEATRVLVGALDRAQLFALRDGLNEAERARLLPLDIDVDVLERIVTEDLAASEVLQLVHAFALEARYERMARRFDARGEGYEAFAERARAEGAGQRARFLCGIGEGCDAESVEAIGLEPVDRGAAPGA